MADSDGQKPEIRYGLTDLDLPGHQPLDVDKLPPDQRRVIDWFVNADPVDTGTATQGIVELRRAEQGRELDK